MHVRVYESFSLTIYKSLSETMMTASNKLTGSLPSEIGLLTSLQRLHLGEWPDQIFFICYLVLSSMKCLRNLIINCFLFCSFQIFAIRWKSFDIYHSKPD